MDKRKLHPAGLLFAGFLLGAFSRLLDLYTQNLGNLFSEMAIWILLGVLISIYSPSKKAAMLHIFLFCIAMLFAYYGTAFLMKGVYGRSFLIGWTIFAFFSPLFAYLIWLTKKEGVLAKLIAAAVVLLSIASSILLFDRLHLHDIVIDALLIYFLFFKKAKR